MLFGPLLSRWWTVGFALPLALVIGTFLRNGVALSTDSVTYLAVAHHVAAGDGFISSDGHHISEFMFAYPLALAGLVWLGNDQVAAAVVNILAFAVVIFAARLWLMHSGASAGTTLVATTLIGLGYPVLYVWQFAWSEPLFIAATTAALAAHSAMDRKPSARLLAAATIATSIAVATRYAGVFIVLTGALMLVRRQRWVAAGGFAGVSLLPLLTWIAHNHQVSDSTAGQRGGAVGSFGQSAIEALATMGRWFMGPLPHRLAAMVMLSLVVGVFVVARTRELSAWTFVGVYGIGLVALAASTGISAPNNRLMVPLFPALIVVFARAAESAPQYVRNGALVWSVAMAVGSIGITVTRIVTHTG